jgi:hypothetical protein
MLPTLLKYGNCFRFFPVKRKIPKTRDSRRR